MPDILAAERERRMLTRDADTLEAAARILGNAGNLRPFARLLRRIAVTLLTGVAARLRKMADAL